MLEIKNISYSIGDKKIIDNFSCIAHEGMITALLGTNGAGKSTLIKLISGSIKPTAGSIYWYGKNISENKKNELARTRAVMTQNARVSNDYSVREIAMMGRYPFFKHQPGKDDENIVDRELDAFGLKSFSGRNYNSLSGGEQQRVQFARAMIQLHTPVDDFTPRLFLLDEPLNNLDIRYQYECLERAAEFARAGHVVIAVLHDINIALEFAEHFVLMQQGRCFEQGDTYRITKPGILSGCFDVPLRIVKSDSHHTIVKYEKNQNEIASILENPIIQNP